MSQESSAEKAIAALQEYSANVAKVIRDAKVQRVKADELVPGDIIKVAVGDRVPADCRILSIHSNSFRIDQSILTGESESVGKETAAIEDAKAVKQDQVNMLFSGTTVVTGNATAVVVLTGSNTAIGDIHENITSQISQPTPLKEKLNDFGDTLAKVITVICILVWLINIPHFNDPAHGSFAKGAIYYLKVSCTQSLLVKQTTNHQHRLLSRSVLPLFPKVWLLLLPPASHWEPARWLLRTPWSAVSPQSRLWAAAVLSAQTRPEPLPPTR